MKKPTKEFKDLLAAAMETAGLGRDRPGTAKVLATSESTLEKWLRGVVTPHELTQEAALARLVKAKDAFELAGALEAVQNARQALDAAVKAVEAVASESRARMAASGGNG